MSLACSGIGASASIHNNRLTSQYAAAIGAVMTIAMLYD
jgi:hypothetical protein